MMYFNNRGNYRVYGPGCSMFGCMIALIIMSFIIRGSMVFFFRYFWLIVVLGLIIWVFRKFNTNNSSDSTSTNIQNTTKKSDWSRDFEKNSNTSYHNVEREFEEVDDNDEEEFKDF